MYADSTKKTHTNTCNNLFCTVTFVINLFICSSDIQTLNVYTIKLLNTITTRHRASTSMYSLTFCVRFLLPERHQWKARIPDCRSNVENAPVGGQSPTGRPRPLAVCGARFWGCPPSPADRRRASGDDRRRPATRADPAQPAVRTML